jgi:hypothetical protein
MGAQLKESGDEMRSTQFARRLAGPVAVVAILPIALTALTFAVSAYAGSSYAAPVNAVEAHDSVLHRSTPITATATAPALTAPTQPLTSVNGIPLASLVLMPDDVRSNVRAIYMRGLQLGNDARAFSAVGDSSIAGGQFLERFGKGPVNLGDYGYLQDVLAQFTPSFTRTSTSVRIGLHSWSVLNPAWADKRKCEPNETVIACEFRLHKPGIVFIRLGANDSPMSLFDRSMRRIVAFAIENGVIPILITKANSPNAITNENNGALRRIADDYKVPLIDFDRLAQTLPQRGLGKDNVHMTGYLWNDFTLASTLNSGHAMHNLAALIGLDAVWREARSQPLEPLEPLEP